MLTRDLNFSGHYLDAVQNVTLDDIKRVATQYLTENNLTVVSLNPKGSLTAKTQGSKVVAAGEIQKFELSNGLRLLVREDPRLPLVAMGAVFILNSVALFVFPAVGHLLHLSQTQFGLWSAIAIHDTSSVIMDVLRFDVEKIMFDGIRMDLGIAFPPGEGYG